ncbi:hypothetical protein QBC40DRAFT_307036 [Triangularia verruculosa]|uniref:Uncharacterized protein n=1 Tax=Triangularia verruculosa TaxID=2587418 RepID=A0AAN6XI87_9PEZI|nr:hypothetical protein QBC40DRAFT_307036 [Triangularia verruculosa]
MCSEWTPGWPSRDILSRKTQAQHALTIIESCGIGPASARKTLFLSDYSKANLDTAATSLRNDGRVVQTRRIDVLDYSSVLKIASAAVQVVNLETIVRTAGLSPAMAPADRILKVDLLGTVNAIDAFRDHIAPGGSMICIASMARFGVQPSSDLAAHFATGGRDMILERPELKELAEKNDPATTYLLSKAANYLRVQAASRVWAEKGARINIVGPGVILTTMEPMVRQELESPRGETVKQIIAGTPLQRGGTTDEIASAVAFLSGNEASYVTGTDILVDGGYC